MASNKLNVTKDYRIFKRSEENRVTDIRRHRKLERSMKQYGFLKSFPISCHRLESGGLVVKDGQHRLAIAETLGLPVYWVEEVVDFDIALVNSTGKTWGVRDYAEKYAANGKKDYAEGLEFADRHKINVGSAFAMLAGTTNYSNIEPAYKDGDFKISDREWAEQVAAIYRPITELNGSCKTANFLGACMAVCRVDGFDGKRLVRGAERCREKLGSYSTREAYLDMLEQIYNFGRMQLVGLKSLATMAMRSRSATEVTKAQKAAKGGKHMADMKSQAT